MGNRFTWILILACLALGGALAARDRLELWPRGPITPRTVAATDDLLNPPEPVQSAPVVTLDDLTETVDRPLFAASRRPPAAEPAAPVEVKPVVAPPALPPPKLELSAVVIEPLRRFALFRGGSSGLLRADQGTEVEGWLLREVRADGVTLERNGERHDIALRTFKAPSAPRRAPRRAPVPARAQKADAESDAELQPRPRRPLRGPRRRSARRAQTQ